MTGSHIAAKAAHHIHDFAKEAFGGKPRPDFNFMPFWMRLNPLHMVKISDFVCDVCFRALRTDVLQEQLEV